MITNVLLVDDHPVFRKGLRLLLEDESDFRVVGEAGDGLEALELVSQLDPDVVVMDISMPGMDGIQSTQSILSEAPHTKVIALSIHSEKGFVEGMLLSGASGYILKESAPEEIVDGILAVRRGEVFLSAAITGIVVDEYRRALAELPAAMEAAELAAGQILSTKLHRPAITPDLLTRTQLQEMLDQGRHGALILISAPAGYGKSTLANMWLEASEYPCAWLSLDGDDNDLRIFLTHVIAAIRTQFPEACGITSKMLGVAPMPALKIIVANLISDIENIESEFVLVLDDYHLIHEMGIHNLLNELLRRPNRRMRLLIASRGDPPLDLNQLRASGQMIEIRQKDLRFSAEESSTFLNDVMGIRIDQEAVAKFHEKTEGWVTALRLAALSLHHREDVAGLLSGLQGDSRYVQDYLTAEVVSHQPPEIQSWLLKTSILERFNAPLCEAVCQEDEEQAENKISGRAFLEWLEDAGLFTIALDDRGEWFRYHHLFQSTLLNWLQSQYQKDEINALHARANVWFAENGLIDDAIQHALDAGDIQAAAEIVEGKRHTVLDDDRWYVLEKWLSMLPVAVVGQRPELLMAQVHLCIYQHNLLAIFPTLEKIEQILGTDESNELLWGEINHLKGYINYFQGQGSSAQEHQRRALELIPESFQRTRGEAELHFALSLHMTGEKEQALQELNNLLRIKPDIAGTRSIRLWGGLSFIQLLEAELDQVFYPAQQWQDIAIEHGDVYAETYALYIQTCAAFFQNDQVEAAQKLSRLIENRYVMQSRLAVDSMCGLALLYQMKGETGKAAEASNQLVNFAQNTNDPGNILAASSSQARLSLIQGDNLSAVRWLRSADTSSDVGIMLWWIEVPRITECRVLVAEGSGESLQKAVELLQVYQQENQDIHNKYQEIVILSLLTLAYLKQKEDNKAMSVLKEALDLAYPGGWIWPFIELGSPMLDLLGKLKKQVMNTELINYIDQILAAFPSPEATAAKSQPTDLIDPLTERELQVLKLLATALTTDEIADELVVSVNTVRMHTKNIYSKLGAHSRIEAVERGRALGLI